ncbi:hypothetical protein [Mariprofundus ferrooxydans]|uniref:hypothetical protein n=1 Tax=Mariprofundus ferrooxydans TaxID=314344 RepID=UPI00142F671D|nr:hypothetical protein [Mariprofundus ferrooxydans]
MTKQINIRVDASTYAWIQSQAKQDGINVSAMTRRLVSRSAQSGQQAVQLEEVARMAAERVSQAVIAKLEMLAE